MAGGPFFTAGIAIRIAGIVIAVGSGSNCIANIAGGVTVMVIGMGTKAFHTGSRCTAFALQLPCALFETG